MTQTPPVSTDTSNLLAAYRQRARQGDTLSRQEMIEVIRLLRQDRMAATDASKASKASKAKAAGRSADELLGDLGI